MTMCHSHPQLTEEEASRRDAVNRKADASELHRVAERKADIAHVKEALQHKADRSTVDSLKGAKAVSSELAGRIVLLKEELESKAGIKVEQPTVCLSSNWLSDAFHSAQLSMLKHHLSSLANVAV
jgi:hypothetical protein